MAGDWAGFPNGRRVTDDVVAIELKAIAGALLPLADPSSTADTAAGILTDRTVTTNPPYPSTFPDVANPNSGYKVKPGIPGV